MDENGLLIPGSDWDNFGNSFLPQGANNVFQATWAREYDFEMEKKLDVEYARQKALLAEGKPTPIRREVDKVKLNEFYHDIYNEYWSHPDYRD